MKIGDSVFRAIPYKGVFSFSVEEVRETKEGKHYLCRCNQCNHSPACEVLIAEDEVGNLVHVCVANAEEVDDECDKHSWWHRGIDFYYRRTAREAKIDRLRGFVDDARTNLKKAEDDVAARKIRLAELENAMDLLKEEPTND